MNKILEAINFASIAHDRQYRVDKVTPFISHPVAVGMILASHGYDEDVVAAGILHDVVEDTSYTHEDIVEEFGPKIAEIVRGVTEDKSLPRGKVRFEAYIKNLAAAGDDSKAVCAADMLHNRLSTISDIRNDFDIFKALHSTKAYTLEISNEKMKVIRNAIKPSLLMDLEETLKDFEKI